MLPNPTAAVACAWARARAGARVTPRQLRKRNAVERNIGRLMGSNLPRIGNGNPFPDTRIRIVTLHDTSRTTKWLSREHHSIGLSIIIKRSREAKRKDCQQPSDIASPNEHSDAVRPARWPAGNGIRRQEPSKLHDLDLRARSMSVFGLEGAVLLAALSPAAWYNIGLVVVLVALAIAGVMAYQVWHEVNEEIEPATPEELLASFEQARSEGELDDEEYARVRREIEKISVPSTGVETSPPRRPDRHFALIGRWQADRPEQVRILSSVDVEVLAIQRSCGVDSRPRHADEGDELDDLGNVAKIGLDLLERGRERPALAIEDSEDLAQARRWIGPRNPRGGCR